MYLAVLSSPFPSHLGQMSRAIVELLRRGHRVEIWGDSSLERVAGELGAGFRLVPLPPDLGKAATGESENPKSYYARFAFPLVAHQLPRVLKLTRRHAPDLLHANARVYTAALVARLAGVRCSNHCCSGLSFALEPEDLFGFRPTGRETPRLRGLMTAMNHAFHRDIDAMFHRIVSGPLGLAPVDNVLGLSSRTCVLSLSCAELANRRLAALEQTTLTGPLIVEPEGPGPPTENYGYVSLGTWPLDPAATLDIYRTVVRATLEFGPVVVGLGGRFEPSALGIDDPRATILTYAPQERLIRGAGFVVCHGGCQTVHEALYFARPLVMLPPDLAEPREMAHRVAALGAGITLDHRRVGRSDVARAIRAVLREPSYRRAASTLGRSLRAAGGVRRAADVLERAAGER